MYWLFTIGWSYYCYKDLTISLHSPSLFSATLESNVRWEKEHELGKCVTVLVEHSVTFSCSSACELMLFECKWTSREAIEILLYHGLCDLYNIFFITRCAYQEKDRLHFERLSIQKGVWTWNILFSTIYYSTLIWLKIKGVTYCFVKQSAWSLFNEFV